MRRLFDIDIKDYEAGYNVYRRPSARGIILQGDRIALVYSGREHYYKFPGGGIQGGEDKKAALVREVREETGLVVIPDRRVTNRLILYLSRKTSIIYVMLKLRI